MGEISEMMLDGTLCACCGEFLGDTSTESPGYPIYCASCEETPAPKENVSKRRKKKK